jgi:hypothetical protein
MQLFPRSPDRDAIATGWNINLDRRPTINIAVAALDDERNLEAAGRVGRACLTLQLPCYRRAPARFRIRTEGALGRRTSREAGSAEHELAGDPQPQ